MAAKKEGEKATKSAASVEAQGMAFSGFGLETYGCWGPSAVRLLGELKEHAAAAERDDTRASFGWCAPHVSEAARQMVVVARMKGIAGALVGSAAKRRL